MYDFNEILPYTSAIFKITTAPSPNHGLYFIYEGISGGKGQGDTQQMEVEKIFLGEVKIGGRRGRK